jgi:hypothetical protein
MPAIIYQKTPGGLFATGERTVTTFPSGLIRVDQSFVCPTSDADTHRAALAVGEDMPGGSAPAIDGLKIFPEPQEKKRDNGFTEFIVSAYGRSTTNVSANVGYETNINFETLILKRNVELKYVIKIGEDTIKAPTIDSSVQIKRVSRNNLINLQDNNGNLLNQSISITTGTKKNIDPVILQFSFIGDGSVTFSGGVNPPITVTGISQVDVKTQNITLNNVSKNYGYYWGQYYVKHDLQIQVNGDVKFAALDRNLIESTSYESLSSLWAPTNTSISNFGTFYEVNLSYVSR